MTGWLYREGWSPLLVAAGVVLAVAATVHGNWLVVVSSVLVIAGQLIMLTPYGRRRYAQRVDHRNPDDFYP